MSSSPPNQHSSARSALSDAQRKARKRESDRICQRRKRKKDRENVKMLEVLLHSLYEKTEDTTVHDLLINGQRDRDCLQRHRKRLLQMQEMLQTALADFGDDNSAATTSIPNDERVAQFSDAGEETVPNPPEHETRTQGPLATISTAPANSMSRHENSFLPVNFDFGDDLMSLEGIERQSQPWTSMLDEQMQEPATWQMPPVPQFPSTLNPILSSMMSVSPAAVQNTAGDSGWRETENMIIYAQNQPLIEGNHRHHIFIQTILTAINKGWNEIIPSLLLDARWVFLHRLDEFCVPYGKVERLAVSIAASQCLNLNLRHGIREEHMSRLAPFLRPRPSQLSVPHSVIADFYVWPGFRERLTFLRPEYHTVKFLNEIHSNFKFLWPYDFRDTYVYNRQAGIYELSRLFVERSQDLRCWTMNSDFVAKYPEFQGDFPVFNPPPVPLDFNTKDNGWYYFPWQPEEESGQRNRSKESPLVFDFPLDLNQASQIRNLLSTTPMNGAVMDSQTQ